jgi:N-acylneuraminate cytidylyltransferase/CMP-N,N'-diacetyllegionaminic acid synthase
MTSSVDVALYELDRLETAGKHFDVVVLIEPTSPLRKSSDLDNGVETLHENNVQACVSFVMQKQLPQHSFLQDHEGIVRNRENLSKIGRRQDEIAPLYPCGIFYAVEVEALREQRSFYPLNTLRFLVDQAQGFDIDEQLDFDIISKLAEREEYKWLH